MFLRALCARGLAALGLVVIRLAMSIGGGGSYSVEVEVGQMYPEPVWVGLMALIGIPLFWAFIVVLFAASGSM